MNKIIYLDAAASYQKPESVIRAEVDFLSNKYANSGRGICRLATDVDSMVLRARQVAAEFIGAQTESQIVFTAGTTDGFNKIAVSIKPLLSDLKIDKLAFIITPSYYDEFLSFIDVNESKVYNLYDIILEKFYNQSLNIRLLTSIFDKIPDELLQTVYNYIKCNQSIAKTSDLMFTHRNTINYRINKFINMTNINVREINNSMFVYFVISLINVRK
jgi:hypothetical protein